MDTINILGSDVSLSLLGTIGSVIAGLATIAAVFVVLRAVRSAGRSALLGQLVIALGDLIWEAEALSHEGTRLSKLLNGEAQSRAQLYDRYSGVRQSLVRVRLLASSLRVRGKYADWVLNNTEILAVNVFQANEFGAITRDYMEPEDESRPTWLKSDQDWQTLKASLAYRMLAGAISELGSAKAPLLLREKRFDRMVAEHILTSAHEENTVYSLSSSYLVQSSRLLDDFNRTYLRPWAEWLVKERRA